MNDINANALGYVVVTDYLEANTGKDVSDAIQKIIDENPSNGEAYYYYSLSLLNGLRPFLNNREQIDHIIQNLNFAISVGFKGKYAYLKALAINDFYNMKSIRYPETYQSCLEMAAALGVTEEEKAEIFTLLKFKKPTNF